jgi:tetratricopeptide (TPR) repeat protein
MKCANRLLFCVGLLFVVVYSARADFVADGRAAFAKGDYPAAAQAFESALETLGPSAALYYNLAVVDQKRGEHAQAALNLRRAIVLDPRMTDARMALSEIERSQGVPPAPSNWRDVLAERAPLKTLLMVGCGLAWLGAFLLLFVVFMRDHRILPVTGAVALLAFGGAIFVFGYLADPRVSERNVAIVSQNSGVPLLSTPADQSAAVTKLPAAAAVRILQERGEWTFCSAPSGEKGWAPSKSLERVVPAA